MTRVLARGLCRPSWPALIWIGVLVIAVVAGVVLAVHSDAANTDVRTADEPPKTAGAPLADRVSPLWTSADIVDDQRAVAGDTVITSTARGVRGLDPATGAERWHYQRSTATMCDLTVLDDVVVAIFRTTGRCNEAVALEAATGQRRWYRNVGFSDDARLLGAGTAAVAVTPGGIAVLDAVRDSIRWRYNPPQGCELSSIGVGSGGVVVLEQCETGTTWLAQFELYSGQQQWRVPPPAGEVVVLGADGVVTLLAEEQLWVLSVRDGRVLSALPAAADSGTATFAGQVGARGVPLVYLGGTVYAIDPATGSTVWIVAARGLPASSEFGVVVPEADAFVIRNPLTGEELARSVPLGDAASQALTRVERVGSVVVAVAPDGITAYG